MTESSFAALCFIPMGFMIRMLTKAVGMPAGKGGKFDWNGIVKDSGLAVVSLHTDLGSLERDSGAVIKEAQSYNTKNLVITECIGLTIRMKIQSESLQVG